jgi:hypothetical protein
MRYVRAGEDTPSNPSVQRRQFDALTVAKEDREQEDAAVSGDVRR